MAIHKAAEGIHADADPSVTFNRKSARMERQAPSKSPFTVIIMADAEELLHLNKQVNWIPIRMVRQFHLQHTRTKKRKIMQHSKRADNNRISLIEFQVILIMNILLTSGQLKEEGSGKVVEQQHSNKKRNSARPTEPAAADHRHMLTINTR